MTKSKIQPIYMKFLEVLRERQKGARIRNKIFREEL
jgi:hypothetical protein